MKIEFTSVDLSEVKAGELFIWASTRIPLLPGERENHLGLAVTLRNDTPISKGSEGGRALLVRVIEN